jgi:hypothetical protein
MVFAEAEHVEGVVALLMKRRNGGDWSADDKIALRRHLKALGKSLPVIGLFALPGGLIVVPVLAMILDRRSRPRVAGKPETLDADRRSRESGP